MIDDALALAKRVAPCVFEDDFEDAAAAKAILRGAVLRWNEQGFGAGPDLQFGPYQVQPKGTVRRFLFFPSEVNELSALCGGKRGKAFSIDTTPVVEVEGS
ncbi:hypothetical protein [Mycolicibacterium peregrinum]|uniref:hypothetical protein n=1 Tax=Mycolicibacterium peregrinum TaxID=43304 RepID=UPI003AAB5E44